jgi:flagellar hook-associated protein 3 FlgL
MLASNLMRNLHINYRRSDKLQNMMSSGRKFANISDDPTSLIYSKAARNKMARLAHFQRTVETSKSWLEQAENSVKELQDVMVNAYEAIVDAATDGKTQTDRQNIAQVIGQLRDHYVDTLNSTFGNNFVFAGYNTPGDAEFNLTDRGIKPFTVQDGHLMYNGFNLSQFDGIPGVFLNNPEAATAQQWTDALGIVNQNRTDAGLPTLTLAQLENEMSMLHQLRSDVLTFDVGPGISMPVTYNGIDMVLFPGIDSNNEPIIRNAFDVLTDAYNATKDNTGTTSASDLTKIIKPLQEGQNHLLMRVAEAGGRTRRLELLEARYEQDQVNNRQMLSDAEDADIAEVIMELRMAEAVMAASMAAGARIIQPSLMDFLR